MQRMIKYSGVKKNRIEGIIKVIRDIKGCARTSYNSICQVKLNHTYLCMYICMYVCMYVYMYVCLVQNDNGHQRITILLIIVAASLHQGYYNI